MNMHTDEAAARPPVDLLHGASLFLDFDGTLVDIAPTPDAVEVSHDLRSLLGRLRALLGDRLVILTGRSSAQVQRFLDPLTLAIGGHHGLEMPSVMETELPERPAALDALVAEFRRLETRFPGVLVEDKPLGIALHYRGAPEAEDECRDAASRAAAAHGLHVQPGKMVFELKLRPADKGQALLRIMERVEFAGTRPVFLGDDLTDEPGFVAAQQLGGAGILIGERAGSAARYRLDRVQDAVGWLAQAGAELE